MASKSFCLESNGKEEIKNKNKKEEKKN